MDWNFMRLGWPNTAAIFALALLPIVTVGFDLLDVLETRPAMVTETTAVGVPVVRENLVRE